MYNKIEKRIMQDKILNPIKYIFNLIKSNWKISLIFLFVLAGGGFFYYKKVSAEQIVLKFEKPIKQDITKSLEVSGFIDAKEKARLRFAAGGKVVYIGAKEGDTVKKWQTIATIDRAALQKQLQKDLNDYMQERYDWEDNRDSVKDRALTTKEFRQVDRNQLDLTNTVLDVEIQDIAIKNTVISAPFEGILTTAPTNVAGTQILASDYFELMNPTTLIFKAAVDEADIALVQKGQTGKINLDSFRDKEIEAQVSYIAYTSTETSSGTSFVIELPITESEIVDKLRVGMNGDVNIILEKKSDVITIPFIAIIQKDNKNFVKVKKDNKNNVEEREISIGIENDEIVEVTSGLSETDEIVVPE